MHIRLQQNDANGDENGWLASDGYDDFPFDFQGRARGDLGYSSIGFVLYVFDGVFWKRRHCAPDVAANLQLILCPGTLRGAGEPIVDSAVQLGAYIVDRYDTRNISDRLDDNACSSGSGSDSDGYPNDLLSGNVIAPLNGTNTDLSDSLHAVEYR